MIYERDANEEASGRGAGRTHCACPPRKMEGGCAGADQNACTWKRDLKDQKFDSLWSKLSIGKRAAQATPGDVI
jgi:hypothetical protein